MTKTAINNDETIMQLKKKIEEKRNKLSTLPNRVCPVTNCMLILDGKTYNLHVDSSEIILIKLNMYRMSAIDLRLSPDDVELCGYTISQWINDVRAFLQLKKYRDEKKQLNDLEKKLNTMLSEEKQTELELDKIAKLLQ